MGVFMVPTLSKSQLYIDILERFLGGGPTLNRNLAEQISLDRPVIRQYSSGATLSSSAVGPARIQMLISGWACREHLSSNGRRQIISLLLPGDLIGVFGQERALDRAEAVALTTVRLADICSMFKSARRIDEFPDELALALAARRRAEDRRLIDQVSRLGATSAHERLAGLILELYQRCSDIGLVHERAFVLPITQELIGNMIGVSLVHVNRLLRQLKAQGLIGLCHGNLTVTDFVGLARAAGLWLDEFPPGSRSAADSVDAVKELVS